MGGRWEDYLKLKGEYVAEGRCKCPRSTARVEIIIAKIASTAKSFHNGHHGDNSTVAEVKR